MKHIKRIPKHEFVYYFTEEELINIVIAFLREAGWPVPHQEDTAARQLIKANSHWELIVAKHHPKALVDISPLLQTAKPKAEPEKKDPMIVDMTGKTSADLFEMSLFLEEREKGLETTPAAAAAAFLKGATRPVPPVVKYPGQGPDDVIKAALARTKEFTSGNIMSELKIPLNNKVGRTRVNYFLARLCKSGDLKKKKVPRPDKPKLTQWVYSRRDK